MGVLAAPYILPKISRRIEDWPIFLLLLLTALSSHVVQSEAIYLRAHKCEPFLIQSIVIALCTAGSVVVFAKTSGALGVSVAYFVVLGVAGVISATLIFRTKRSQWAQAEI
jgi:multidrug transporter EmrE-like cation transporter